MTNKNHEKVSSTESSSINAKFLSITTASAVEDEIKKGISLLQQMDEPLATIYGSHVVNEFDYELCTQITRFLTSIGMGIVSGGGSGIMEAANTTAKNAGVASIGLRGEAFKEEHVDVDIYTHEVSFEYVFVRRFMLCIKSKVLLFFPGGYGTLNELMEILCLMQSRIIDRVPIILVRSSFWEGMYDWFCELEKSKKIKKADLALISFADTPNDVKKILVDYYFHKAQK